MTKRLFSKIHLWLGLISGIIVFILSVTGAIFEFSPEIQHWRYHDTFYTQEVTGRPLPISYLYKRAQDYLGKDKVINWTTAYRSPEKTWSFSSYKPKKGGFGYLSGIDYYESVYVNPYTGKLAGKIDYKHDFFSIIKALHWSLLLKSSIGQPIIGWATIIFVVLLITGLILWWPKSFKHARNLFRIKWRSTTKLYRKLYDLHNVLGFYSLIFALIIALSGMVWAFPWFHSLVYASASGTFDPPKIVQVHSVPESVKTDQHPIDIALNTAMSKYNKAAVFNLSRPVANDSLATIGITVRKLAGRYDRSNQLVFDRYSGKLLYEKTQSQKSPGEKLTGATYDIHVGSILGWPGRILAFLTCIICALLPVTGFIMWWKRNHVKRKSLI